MPSTLPLLSPFTRFGRQSGLPLTGQTSLLAWVEGHRSPVGSKHGSTCVSKRKAHGQDMGKKQGSEGLTTDNVRMGLVRTQGENAR